MTNDTQPFIEGMYLQSNQPSEPRSFVVWGIRMIRGYHMRVLNSVLGLSYQSDYPSDTSKKVQIIQPGIALGALIAPNYQQQ